MPFYEKGHVSVLSGHSPPLDAGISQSQVFSVGSAVYREPRVPSEVVRLARGGVHRKPQVAVPDRGLHTREPRGPVIPKGRHDRVTVALEPLLHRQGQTGLGP